MELYHELKALVKTQLKGHFAFLYGWMFFISFVCFGILQLSLLWENPLVVSLLRILLFLLCVVVNTVMLFLFLLRVRNKPFKKADISYALSKGGRIMVASLFISLVNAMIQTTIHMVLPIPLLALFMSVIMQFFFVSWYVFLAFMVYDHQVNIKDLCLRPLWMMKEHMKTMFLIGGNYVLWNCLSAFFIQFVIRDNGIQQSGQSILQILQLTKIPLVIIVLAVIVFYLIQFAILVVMDMQLANYYEKERYL